MEDERPEHKLYNRCFSQENAGISEQEKFTIDVPTRLEPLANSVKSFTKRGKLSKKSILYLLNVLILSRNKINFELNINNYKHFLNTKFVIDLLRFFPFLLTIAAIAMFHE